MELMIAGMLLSIGLMAVVGLWEFSFRVTANTDDMGVAYNLGRQAMESVKVSGFTSAAEGSTTAYYDGTQATVSASSARYSVTTNIVSDTVSSGTAGVAGAVPSDTALRTVTITVTLYSTSQTLYQTNTYLAKGGV